MSFLKIFFGSGGQVASKTGNNTFFGDLQGKNDIMSDVGSTTFGTCGDCMNSIGDTSYFSGGQVIQKVGNSYHVNGKVYNKIGDMLYGPNGSVWSGNGMTDSDARNLIWHDQQHG